MVTPHETSVLVIALLLNGCLLKVSPLELNLNAPENSTLRHCAELFVETDEAIAQAQVADAGAARIAGYPYLRTNRLLSSFRTEVSGKSFESWVGQLQALALEGWQLELMNLPVRAKQRLLKIANTIYPAKPTLIEALNVCGNFTRKHDLAKVQGQVALKEKAIVPSEYRTWQRIVGLYPISALAFRFGIKQWHEQTLATYHIPLDELPVKGRLVRYTPLGNDPQLSTADVEGILQQSLKNALGVPILDTATEKRLFDTFAPIFEVDVVTNNDKIGAPGWKTNKAPSIDIAKPTVYRHLSYTRLGDKILPQLNYLAWFPSRPKTSLYDLLGGKFDGIIWRVTLGTDGEPWLFDSIHACGCYHLFFPTRDTQIPKKSSIYDEPPLLPQQPLKWVEDQKTVIRIASANHYIERIYMSSQTTNHQIDYDLNETISLRSMPTPDGTRLSIFGQDGIIEVSKRLERFLFWPMGIPSPGAMRQWGHHATAFVGRRHFDDPRLFEDVFQPNTER